MSKIRVAIRADGGTNIGMGHIMRCLALGLELKNLGHEVNFITIEDRQVEQVIINQDLNVIAISKPKNQLEELKTIKKIIKNNDINIVITDSYKIDQSYLVELREEATLLVSIDDLNSWVWPSDIVINGNLYATNLKYTSLDEKSRFLLGGEYTLLREEFQNVPECKIKPNIKQVLVTVGGSDVLNLTPLIIKGLQRVPAEFQIITVIGPNFNNVEEIKSVASACTGKQVVLKTEVNNMRELMLGSDLAISSGGSTLYELATTGTPGVVLLQAENQILAAEKMAQEGTVINLGMGSLVSPGVITDAVTKLLSPQLRTTMAIKGQRLIDGLGAKRCAQFIHGQYFKKRSGY
ncbi:MAG: UDP-2,4-diacetamido-2,4,6-trideoxy-beta-L-altropyranose hydrolase [Clostridia bacterium]|nr:UDP-2,4-diacetamido-2,4,6-trideoxy-beta-L-altropyranose hydrolase [Clostridia bacterium]